MNVNAIAAVWVVAALTSWLCTRWAYRHVYGIPWRNIDAITYGLCAVLVPPILCLTCIVMAAETFCHYVWRSHGEWLNKPSRW